MQNKDNNQSGYTIIETMISISLFVVIVIAGTGALLNANLLHNKSQNMRSIMDNLNFIMEDISRDLRMGYIYKCFRKGIDNTVSLSTISASPVTRSCSNGDGWAIAFESTQPVIGDPSSFTDQWVYYIGPCDNKDGICKSTDGADSFVQLIPNEVTIDPVSGFSVLGAESPPDIQQPFATIRLVGKIKFKDIETPFSLQTSVSQRRFDR